MQQKALHDEPVDNVNMFAEVDAQAAIKIHDLVKRYPKVPINAIDKISLSIKHGEVFGLLGPNGAGKTTLVSMLTSSMLPTSGSIYIMGIDIVKKSTEAKRHIGVVTQRSNLDQSLKARDILIFHAAYHNVPHKIREARANELLAELGLTHQAKQKIGYYSGGMAQRIMLARALMHSPAVIFLDEPTHSLDPQSRLFLWERIQALKEKGITIFLTTHDMVEAEKLCDRIAIIDHGHILALGTVPELKKLVPHSIALEVSWRMEESSPITHMRPQEVQDQSYVLDMLRGILPTTVKIETVQHGTETQQNSYTIRLYGEEGEHLRV